MNAIVTEHVKTEHTCGNCGAVNENNPWACPFGLMEQRFDRIETMLAQLLGTRPAEEVKCMTNRIPWEKLNTTNEMTIRSPSNLHFQCL